MFHLFGHRAEDVVRAARERLQHQARPIQTVDRVRESLTFARDKNVECEAVVDERTLIRDGLRRAMGGVTYSQVRANLNGVHPDLLSSRFGYVAVSRASHEATVFTDDANRLDHRLETEVSKAAALEKTHSVSVGHGLGMG